MRRFHFIMRAELLCMHAEGQANRAADRVHPEEKESLAFEFVE